MNAIDHILVEPLADMQSLKNIDVTESVSKDHKKRAAMDFESVFINKLLDEMKNVIGCWDNEEDGARKQVQGIFNMYLSEGIARSGGFGLWKDIYKLISDGDTSGLSSQVMDSVI